MDDMPPSHKSLFSSLFKVGRQRKLPTPADQLVDEKNLELAEIRPRISMTQDTPPKVPLWSHGHVEDERIRQLAETYHESLDPTWNQGHINDDWLRYFADNFRTVVPEHAVQEHLIDCKECQHRYHVRKETRSKKT